ncbi:MAG: hypothetical protein MR640_05410, partial [Subdoligranulum sp.]|nr:hypothetical protein [Subdoligranulum sp.]
PLRRLRHGICVAKMLDKTSSIICAFGLASAAPRSPYRHLELCGIALKHCNTLPGWQYTGQMTAGGQCSPLRRNFLLSFLIIFYSIISIFYNAR